MEVPEDVAFWSEFAIDANWFESYPTVRETTKAADFAVIANVRSVVPMEPIRGDAPGGDITVVHLVMEVVTDISGSGLKEFTLQLEGGPLEREQYAAWLSGWPQQEGVASTTRPPMLTCDCATAPDFTPSWRRSPALAPHSRCACRERAVSLSTS